VESEAYKCEVGAKILGEFAKKVGKGAATTAANVGSTALLFKMLGWGGQRDR